MRKKFFAIAVAFFCFVMSGCSTVLIEDMLKAPSLTADQNAIMKELSNITTEKVVLKYPTSGSVKAPIQFIDLTGDGKLEAVAFFSIPATGLMTRIAVLSQNENGEWSVESEIEGAGTDVVSLYTTTLKAAQHSYILVEWESKSLNERKVSIYNFIDGVINIGFEERCSDILVTDLNQDGFTEFCYIAEPVVPDIARIYIVDFQDGKFQTVGEQSLKGTLGNSSMVYGTQGDGTPAVFVDQTVQDEMQTTEVFMIRNGDFIRADYSNEYDISEIALRNNSAAKTTTFAPNGVTFIPSEAKPFATAGDLLTYWYSVDSGEIEYAAASYYSREYAFNLTIPNEWLEYAVVTVDEQNPKSIMITDSRAVPPEQNILLQLEVLGLGEDSTHLAENGFEILSSQGTYRYFIKSYGSAQDTVYIKSYFSFF